MEPNFSKPKLILGGLGPLIALVFFVFYILGPGSLLNDIGTPLPDITFDRIAFEDTEIIATIRNTGPVPLNVVMADVNDRIQPAAIEPNGYLERFETAILRIPFSWNEGEPYEIGVTIQDGTRFSSAVDAASPLLEPSKDLFVRLGLIGIYVGIIPIMIGLLWLPFIKKMNSSYYRFFLALTVGLLIFLGIDSVAEAGKVVDENIADIFDGTMLIAISLISSFLILHYLGGRLRKISSSPFILALLIAIGIGIHNFGEGLAIGASVALGSISLSTFLIAGFAIHNATEGIAIASPIAKRKSSILLLVGLGVLAGIPAVFGTWIGGFTFLPFLSVMFLAIGAGALFQVSYSVLSWIREDDKSLSSPSTVGGLILGFIILYITSIVI